MPPIAATIRCGTNIAGVKRDAFGTQPNLVIRYDLPSARLRPYISAYVVHASNSAEPASEWFLPTDAMISIQLDGAKKTLRTLEDRFDLAPASLVGPTSRAYLVEGRCGVQVSIGLRPLGWMALTKQSADTFCDRAIDLKEVTSDRFVALLMSRVRQINDESSLASALDNVLETLLVHGEEPTFDVDAVYEALTVDHELSIAEITTSLGVSGRKLLNMSKMAFGMSPKLLFRRERFLQGFREVLMSGDLSASVVAKSRYFDGSHFLRDATDFLGTTPRRFIAGGTTLQRATLLAEQAVLTGRATAK